uniref:Vacuolar protein sorting-associated protein 26C n=1 Tax=Suricata suricatta TaxID=37032 RepID=A0A673SLU9_SURSU
MGTSLDIKIKRANKVYHAGEVLSGVVVISGKDSIQHQGVSLTVEGSVNLQLSAKSVGVFEAFYNSVKPIQIINSTIEMVKPGKFPSGKTEIPFEFPLHVKGNKVLYETYHGVFVNIQPQKGKLTPSPVDFTITPETLQNVRERALLPKFLIRGHLNSTNCVITQPLTGELLVESSEAAIRSIELQLVRVETCGCAEGYARDATEIQNIQIADGDVCRSLSVPIYMVFPRLFTCPTLETTNFKVGKRDGCRPAPPGLPIMTALTEGPWSLRRTHGSARGGLGRGPEGVRGACGPPRGASPPCDEGSGGPRVSPRAGCSARGRGCRGHFPWRRFVEPPERFYLQHYIRTGALWGQDSRVRSREGARLGWWPNT